MMPATDTHSVDLLWRFEFDERAHVKSLIIRADNVRHALSSVSLYLGDLFVEKYLYSIHRID